MRGVLPQPSIADLGVAELPLDDPERMFDLGPDARLDSLDLIDERAKPSASATCLSAAVGSGCSTASCSELII